MQRLLQKIGSMLFISVLLLAITNEAIAQNGAQTITNVVVVKPINKSKIDVFFENLIQRNLQEAIASNNGYKAVINESVDAILQESSFKQSGLVSESQRARS